ncbi:MAG: thioredoxin 1 [Glaciecola sp.]|jgi:thioredoxin 1
MSNDSLVNVTSAEHLAELLAGDLPVLVDFTAEWCSPCKQVEPDLHAFAADNAERLVVAAVDIDRRPDIYAAWGINGVPSYRLAHGGTIQMATSGMYREGLDASYGSYLDANTTAPGAGQPLPTSVAARTLAFPDSEIDGVTLMIVDPAANAGPGRGAALPAKGTVEVPAGHKVFLSIDGAAASPSALAGLADITLAVCDEIRVVGEELSDAHVEHLAHLGKLKTVVISRGQLTNDGIATWIGALEPQSFVVMGLGRYDDALVLVASVSAAAPNTIVGSNWCTPEVTQQREAAGLTPLAVAYESGPIRNLSASIKAMVRGGELSVKGALLVPEGWYAFAAGSQDGLGIEIQSATEGVNVTGFEVTTDDAGHVSATAMLSVTLGGDTASLEELALNVRVQICSGDVCQPPQILTIKSGPVMDMDAMLAGR